MKILSIIVPVYNQPKLVVRALDSIPVRDDIEVICIDDCSTDNTYSVLQDYVSTSKLNITLLHNEFNRGVGYTTNRGYDIASGKWIVGLDNDDYLYTDKYSCAIDKLYSCDDFDMVYILNDINNGNVWGDTTRFAIWSYFIKKEFLGKHRMHDNKNELVDWRLKLELSELNPIIGVIDTVCYHYNYPRAGSLPKCIRGKNNENLHRNN